jgi:uncharacterized protein DUF402
VWSAGDSVLWRGIVDGRVRWALPHTFVEETPAHVAVYIRPGVVGMRPRLAFIHYPEQLRTGRWEIQEHRWRSNHVLRLTPPGAAHSVDLYWSEGSFRFRGWYVNLQEPLRSTPLGYDTRDHALDIWVEPDRTWRWKDEDHLEEIVRLGVYSTEQATRIRAEGERVLRCIEAWDSPFCDGWEQWRPSPRWSLPTLPDGWNVV